MTPRGQDDATGGATTERQRQRGLVSHQRSRASTYAGITDHRFGHQSPRVPTEMEGRGTALTWFYHEAGFPPAGILQAGFTFDLARTPRSVTVIDTSVVPLEMRGQFARSSRFAA